MRKLTTGIAALALATVAPARAEPGGFFKNLFSGDKNGGETTLPSGPQMYDPSEAYCPPVSVADGAAAIRAFAGAGEDGARLRHQITFARISRECVAREDGTVGVKVGAEVQALLGPVGTAGSFTAPLTVAIYYGQAPVTTRTRRVTIPVPRETGNGTATIIESDLVVPADKAQAYSIIVGLGMGAARPSGGATAKARRPAAQDAAANQP